MFGVVATQCVEIVALSVAGCLMSVLCSELKLCVIMTVLVVSPFNQNFLRQRKSLRRGWSSSRSSSNPWTHLHPFSMWPSSRAGMNSLFLVFMTLLINCKELKHKADITPYCIWVHLSYGLKYHCFFNIHSFFSLYLLCLSLLLGWYFLHTGFLDGLAIMFISLGTIAWRRWVQLHAPLVVVCVYVYRYANVCL